MIRVKLYIFISYLFFQTGGFGVAVKPISLLPTVMQCTCTLIYGRELWNGATFVGAKTKTFLLACSLSSIYVYIAMIWQGSVCILGKALKEFNGLLNIFL